MGREFIFTIVLILQLRTSNEYLVPVEYILMIPLNSSNGWNIKGNILSNAFIILTLCDMKPISSLYWENWYLLKMKKYYIIVFYIFSSPVLKIPWLSKENTRIPWLLGSNLNSLTFPGSPGFPGRWVPWT